MTSAIEVPADKLAWRCDLSFLPFTCTADMTPLEDFIGQERAMRAIQFGLGVDKPGFNIFVTGLSGTGNQHHQSFSKKNHRRPSSGQCRFSLPGGLVLRLQF